MPTGIVYASPNTPVCEEKTALFMGRGKQHLGNKAVSKTAAEKR